jgi:hypothetical protein
VKPPLRRRLIPTALRQRQAAGRCGTGRGTSPKGFRETRVQDGGQVFGGYAVQVDCTQRLNRAPHSGSGWTTSPAWEAPRGRDTGRTCQRAPAPEHKQSPLDGATPRMTAAAIAGRGARPTPTRRRRLGTKWESRALARALHSSVPLTCARVHLRKYGPDLVAAIGMHGWGSRGRRFATPELACGPI